MAEIYNQVFYYTERQIDKILKSGNEGSRKANLANLRKGVGYAPGEIPELWGIFLQNMPEEFYSPSGKPSFAEWAVYTALTLFALHQQGHDPVKDPMSKSDVPFGSAVARLVHSDDEKERVLRRFNTVATSTDITEVSYHLRTLIQLLRGEGIPLDYPALAKDLYFYQNTEFSPSVRLRWGQDFYRELNKKYNTNNGEEENHD